MIKTNEIENQYRDNNSAAFVVPCRDSLLVIRVRMQAGRIKHNQVLVGPRKQLHQIVAPMAALLIV